MEPDCGAQSAVLNQIMALQGIYFRDFIFFDRMGARQRARARHDKALGMGGAHPGPGRLAARPAYMPVGPDRDSMACDLLRDGKDSAPVSVDH